MLIIMDGPLPFNICSLSNELWPYEHLALILVRVPGSILTPHIQLSWTNTVQSRNQSSPHFNYFFQSVQLMISKYLLGSIMTPVAMLGSKLTPGILLCDYHVLKGKCFLSGKRAVLWTRKWLHWGAILAPTIKYFFQWWHYTNVNHWLITCEKLHSNHTHYSLPHFNSTPQKTVWLSGVLMAENSSTTMGMQMKN